MRVDLQKAEEEYNQLRATIGEEYPKGKCKNILALFQSLDELVDFWLKWNAKKLQSHDFCMAFEKVFRSSIRQTIKQKRTLKHKILRQMVREA